MKVAGVLLVTCLLITPSATARFYADTPEEMVVFVMFYGKFAVIIGLSISW